MLDWINPEYDDLVAAYREYEQRPEAAEHPDFRGFVIPAADTQE
jgi:hypothetical protein